MQLSSSMQLEMHSYQFLVRKGAPSVVFDKALSGFGACRALKCLTICRVWLMAVEIVTEVTYF
eukprot:5077684-Amphidinium_carterae.1